MSSDLNHIVTGADRDFALLLVHPLGSDLTVWDDFIAALDGRLTTLAYDQRGAGRSPFPRRPVDLAEHATDLEALRTGLGIRNVAVVGCAIGAMTAATYAAQYPAQTQALILTNPTPCSAPQAKAMLTERAAKVRREGIASLLPDAVERAFLEMPRNARYDRYMKRFSEQDPDAYAEALIAAAEADASDALRAVRCPTLLVPGRHDVLLPMERTEAVAALVPQAEIVVIEDAAHFIPYQQPAEFAALALDFLGRHGVMRQSAANSPAPERHA
jgi:3-oxoadipate enol-lactonase